MSWNAIICDLCLIRQPLLLLKFCQVKANEEKVVVRVLNLPGRCKNGVIGLLKVNTWHMRHMYPRATKTTFSLAVQWGFSWQGPRESATWGAVFQSLEPKNRGLLDEKRWSRFVSMFCIQRKLQFFASFFCLDSIWNLLQTREEMATTQTRQEKMISRLVWMGAAMKLFQMVSGRYGNKKLDRCGADEACIIY